MQSRSSGGVGGDWRKRRGSESSESSSAGNDNDIYDGELLPQDNDDYVVTHQIASDSDDDDSGRGVPSVAGGGPASAGASPPSASPGADADDGRGSVTPVIASRAYQLEMFEASMRENVIVAMDTGSGKTQVAILRMQAELERAPKNQIIWFLAGKVELCKQQYRVIKSQISWVDVKLLTGEDNVDAWSTQAVWDAVLRDVRIVVSTDEVLRGAMQQNAFVKMEQLALIVFDEAHNCRGKSASAKIMEMYRERKLQGRPVPHIMGLTASPVMGSNPAEMKDLEKILDAVCRTPTMHRDELLAHSNRPELSHIVYPAVDVDYLPRTPAMMSLFEIMSSLSLDNDPYVVELKIFDKLPQNQRKLDKVYNPKTEGNYETRVQIQARAFCRRVDEMNRELGHWAADHYIAEVVRRFAAIADREASHSPPPATTAQEGAISATMNWGARIRPKENRYLAWMLSQVCVTPPDPSMLVNARPPTLSGKLQRLIDLLSEPRTTNEKIVGIIFVEQRTTVVLLAHILSLHPATSQRFRVGRLVGTSKNDKRARAEMADVLEAATSRDLERFRAGNLNLLVTTSVAEEGIDIPSCNLVICFDEPQKLTSFIQRRGRARMKRSRLIVFTEEASTSETGGNTRGRKVIDWPALEAEMKRQFDRDETERNEIRRLEEAAEIEAANSAADTLKPIFSSVGARLDMDNARARLEHFCAKVLRRSAFVDHKPEFIVSETPSVDATTTTLAAANNHANNSMSNNAPITATTSTTAVTPSKRRRRAAAAAQAQSQEPPALRAVPKLLTATVILPAGLPDSLRTFKSSRAWLSERAACKDAAFAACAALYEEGFLNDHFLPVTAEESMGSEGGELDELAGLTRIVEGRDSLVEVLQRRSGWEQVVETKWWADRHYLGNVGGKEEIVYAREIRLRDADGAVTATAELLLPVRTPSEMKGFHLWWDETREGYVEFGAEREVPTQFRERERMGLYMRETKELIGLAYGHRWRFEDDDLVVRFASPCACRTEKPQVTFQLSEGLLRSMPGCLIRDGFGCLYEYRGWLPSRPPRHLVRKAGRDYDDWPEDEPYITCDKYSRRTDFIHRLPPSTDSNQSTEKEELSGGDAEAEVESEPRYSYVIPARECTIEPADRALVDLSRALPCITHVVETWMLAMTLQRTLLADVGICNLELVLTAITARSAREVRDYERLELLGDSILKLYATLNVAARYKTYPEGILSLFKDRLVSNARLARATMESGLDRFIITSTFTGIKWRPLYLTSALQQQNQQQRRKLSSKTLADVVEALVGAAYVDGGIEKAGKVLATFLPDKEIQWRLPDEASGVVSDNSCRSILYDARPHLSTLPDFEPLERLIGYRFRNKYLLIEAVTHASFDSGIAAVACIPRRYPVPQLPLLGNAGIDGTTSPPTSPAATRRADSFSGLVGSVTLDRLEFIGDALLDYAVVRRIHAHGWSSSSTSHSPSSTAAPGIGMASLPIRKMHLLRTALVNADLLAFLCMNLALEDHFTHTATTAATRERRYGRQGPSAVTPEVVAKPEPFPLWRFMRLGSRKLALERDAAVTRERRLRSAIWARLRQGDRYPWAHFARVKAPKPMSDMVEALIGAIWVDSLPTRDYNGGSDSGSMAAVDAFLSRLGLLQLLDRFLADKVDVIHPKEELCTRLATHPESKPWWEVYDLTLPQPSAGFAVNGSQPELPVDWDGRTAAVGRAGGEEAADGDDGPDDCWAMQGDFACRMHVGDELIAHVRGCIDKKEAIIRAAEVAVAKFRARAAAAVTAAAGEHMGEKAFISDLCGDVAFAVQSIEV